MPAENLLTPDTVRRVMWEPAGADLPALGDQLRALGAREWQIELTAPMLLDVGRRGLSRRTDSGRRLGPNFGPSTRYDARSILRVIRGTSAGVPRSISSSSGSTARSSSSDSATTGGYTMLLTLKVNTDAWCGSRPGCWKASDSATVWFAGWRYPREGHQRERARRVGVDQEVGGRGDVARRARTGTAR